jgi:hypothetical protein
MMSRRIEQQFDGIPPLKQPGLLDRALRPWRQVQLHRSQKKEAERRQTPERRFQQLLETAEAIAALNPHGLADLVSAILRPLQSEHLLAVAEYGMRGRDSISSSSFFGPAIGRRLVTADGMEFRGPKRAPSDYPLSLARDPVLPWPWNHDRFVTAVATIGAAKELTSQSPLRRWQGAWRQDDNHGVELWLPWRIGFVTRGNHSITAGILAGEGHLVPNTVYDMGFLLDEVRCDGRFYRCMHSREALAPMRDPRIGAVFEIGRLLRGIR